MFLRFFVNKKYLNDARNIWSTIQVVTETSTQSVFRKTRSSFICGINEAHAAKLFCWTRELIQTEHCGGSGHTGRIFITGPLHIKRSTYQWIISFRIEIIRCLGSRSEIRSEHATRTRGGNTEQLTSRFTVLSRPEIFATIKYFLCCGDQIFSPSTMF